MDVITHIFGEGKDINSLQMSCRAVVMFMIAVLLVRIAGLKTFGKPSAFDNVVTIMLGAVLSRAVTGEAPFVAVVCAGLTMVVMTRFISWLSIYYPALGVLVKGRHKCLYKDGRINHSNLKACVLSESDLMEGVRKEGNTTSLQDID